MALGGPTKQDGAGFSRALARRTVPEWAVLVGIPLLFLVVGTLIRYSAYASQVAEASPSGYVQALCQWDCRWYERLVREGYEAFPLPAGRSNVGSWGFFPLYPMLVAGLKAVVDLPILVLATLLSTVLTFATCLLAWPLLNRDSRAYTLYAALLLAGPFSYHYATLLTESLFMLLTSAVLLAVRSRRWLLAAACNALLAATRIVGVFAVLVTLAGLFREFRAAGGRTLGFPQHLLRRPDLLFALAVSPLGLFAYMLFLYVRVGDGLAFAHVQRAFGRTAGNPLLFLWDGLTAFRAQGWLPTPQQWYVLAIAVALALSGLLLARRRYGEALFCLAAILLPLSSGLASVVRYTAALTPLGLMLATLLAASRVGFGLALLAFFTGCYFLMIAWMKGSLILV